MDDSCEQSLIISGSDSGSEDERHNNHELSHHSTSSGFRRYIPLLFFALCYYIGAIGGIILLPQYVLEKLREDANLTSNASASSCVYSKSDPSYIKEQKIQQESSAILAEISFVGGIPSILTVLLYGAISDRYGRKVVLIISSIGLFFSHIVVTLTINLKLPLIVYIICSFVTGMTGSFATMLASIFAYTADVTTRKQRSVGIGLMEGSLALSAVITSVIVGYLIKFFGFGSPMIGLGLLMLVSYSFLFCVRETRSTSVNTSSIRELGVCNFLILVIKLQYQDIKQLLLKSGKRTACILLLTASFCFYSFIYIGTINVTTLYLMNQPFCWNSVQLGNYNAIRLSIWQISGFISIVLLRNRVPDVVLLMIGLVSFISSTALQGVASLLDPPFCYHMIFASGGVGLLVSVCPILFRTTASKLVTVDEQGAVFGLIATGEGLAIAFGPSITSIIYSETVAQFHGFIFFFSTGILVIVLISMVVYLRISRRTDCYQELDVNTSTLIQSVCE